MLLLPFSLLADINNIEIRVLPESIVYNDTYSLGDIAELDGFDIETIQKLAKVEIGKSPLPGRSLVVSHGGVRRRVNQFSTERELKLILPSKPTISRASIKITDGQLKELALKEITKAHQEYDNVNVTIRSQFRTLYLPKGNVSYEMKRVGKNAKIGGYSTWALSLLSDEKEVKKLYVRAKVEVFDEVFVAKGKIKKGAKISENDLTKITKNISRENPSYQSKKGLLVGKQARRDIQKNESIKNQLVENPILIKKGSPVKLIYKTKNMLLTNIVKALKAGKKGDIIPVRPTKGRRTIYAVVIDENNVEVAL